MFVRRCVGNDCIGNPTVGDLVFPHFQRHWRDRGHRLDGFNINFRQLFDEGENRVELAAEVFNFTLGDRNSGKMRDAADGVAIDWHEPLPYGVACGCYSKGPTARQQHRSIYRGRPEAALASAAFSAGMRIARTAALKMENTSAKSGNPSANGTAAISPVTTA